MDIIYWVKSEDGKLARRIDSRDIELHFNAGNTIIKMYMDEKCTTEELVPTRKGGIPDDFIVDSPYGAHMLLVNPVEEAQKKAEETAKQLEEQQKLLEQLQKQVSELKGEK